MNFTLKYNTIGTIRKRVTDAQIWVDAPIAREISKVLKEIVIQAKEGVQLDENEQILWDAIKGEILTMTEKEKDKELIRLRAENEALKQTNSIIRNKNKELIASIGD